MRALAGCKSITVVRAAEDVPAGCATELVSDAVSAYMDLKGTVDAAAEAEKLKKKAAAAAKSRDNLLKQVAMADYTSKVPAHIRAENEERVAKWSLEIAEAERGIAEFAAMI